MKHLIFTFLLITASPVLAANSLSFAHCASGFAVIDYSVDNSTNDSHIVVWDGTSSSNKVEIPIAASSSGRIEQDFASEWGGSDNSSIDAYLISSSAVTSSCP